MTERVKTLAELIRVAIIRLDEPTGSRISDIEDCLRQTVELREFEIYKLHRATLEKALLFGEEAQFIRKNGTRYQVVVQGIVVTGTRPTKD